MKASSVLPVSLRDNSKPVVQTDMPRGLVLLFAAASGLSVANVYYAQPLLDSLALDFGISHAAVGGVITATQVGCALALLLLVPLGDRVNRRRLMALQLLALVASLVVVALSQSTAMLLAGMLGVGLLGTAMTQGLIAYAASAAAPHERGRVVGVAQGGVFIGLLLARVFAGGVKRSGRLARRLFVFCGHNAGSGTTSVASAADAKSCIRFHELSTPDCLYVGVIAGRASAANSRRAGDANVCCLQRFLECLGIAT
ncbi:MFS transporter [Vreelandella titanicae]|uniref:MFS transporter n=1 Tax=Halomonadaceae TaxID=28256 RepID=UPI000A47A586|nr:MFS transporter [Halomonas sp. KHS3]